MFRVMVRCQTGLRMTEARTKSPCGAADLLAAIFGEDADKVRAKFGLPLKRKCPICGSYLRKGRCNRPHSTGRGRRVTIACDECGKHFERLEKRVIWEANHATSLIPEGKQHYFCNRKCYGKWFAKHYGFQAHPENACYRGNPRHHDYDIVWQKHIETGFGCRRLGRLLNIPEGTVSFILAKKRREIAEGKE